MFRAKTEMTAEDLKDLERARGEAWLRENAGAISVVEPRVSAEDLLEALFTEGVLDLDTMDRVEEAAKANARRRGGSRDG